MLNGQNPGEVARNLEYYAYIGRARADLIRQHRQLAKPADLARKTREQTSACSRSNKSVSRRRKPWKIEKQARDKSSVQAFCQIRKQRKEIDTLVRDEKRLTRLIERLARLAAENAKLPKSGQDRKRQTTSHKLPKPGQVVKSRRCQPGRINFRV
jgi:murein hydrolase activator